MKRAVVFAFIACWAVTALSLVDDEGNSKPSATVSPAEEFSPTASDQTTLKPTPHNSTTPTPTPQNQTTPTPTPQNQTTPTPTPQNQTTPTPTPQNQTTPTPTPQNQTTPTPTPQNQTTPTPTPHNSTTPKPTTHSPTTPKPTTLPPPQPTPSTNLTVGNYTLTDQKQLCLMAIMALQIRLETPKSNGTFIVQPNLTKTEGTCQGTKANLTIVFKEGFITFMFNKSVADNSVYVDALSFSLSYPFSKGRNGVYTASNKSMHLFNAKIGHYYSCTKEPLYMGNGLYLDVNQDRMQAFNLTKGNEFGKADLCAADQPDYRVAIAVGVTLLVLIVVVVVAYLLGRRRRTDGYQSL